MSKIKISYTFKDKVYSIEKNEDVFIIRKVKKAIFNGNEMYINLKLSDKMEKKLIKRLKKEINNL